MKAMVETEPRRENWRQFCEEPELSADEWILWRKISAIARTDEDFFELCFTTLPRPERPLRTKDWSDVVLDADNWRQHQRAHFPLYEQWLADARAKYTYEPRDYIKFMPHSATDQFAGRLHVCPLCGEKIWSCFGHADKHWQAHGKEKGDDLA